MILISQDGYEVKHNRAGLDWFRTTGPDAFEGLERLANEVRTLGDYEEIDVAITGGRDSRASAAFAFHHFPQEGRGRTSYPPALEKTIAKELVEKLPMFDRYEDDDLAVRTDGSSLWQGFERKQGQYVPIRDRAIDWAFALEGSGIGSALYNKCPIRTPFHLFDKAHVSFAGNGGELGKAYAYHPSQVSGVFAKNVPEWLSQIATTPAYQRLASHPITSSTRLHFVTKDFDQPLDEIILSNFLDALDSGITGYRFFDYWYLVGRMAGAQTPGSTATAQILPFLVPEYINQGGMDTLERKVECQLNEDMVRHYMPSWAGLPYFDQLQNSVPTSQIRYFRVDEHLWSGRDAEYFTAVLNESPAFDAPYDRARMVETFATADDSGLSPALLNVKAHSLIYRHGVYELAESVGQVVAELRDTRLRRWKEPA
ncbi:MAG: hypothetical protein B7Y88_11765 [Sphingomonadales bacterium 32-64-17]|nr:MAG: hypothetical protein B7Y88_11765 [Sphingomonadales bacterium 32-64-17]